MILKMYVRLYVFFRNATIIRRFGDLCLPSSELYKAILCHGGNKFHFDDDHPVPVVCKTTHCITSMN